MAETRRGARKSPLDHEPSALRYALDKSGLSQAELAQRIGRSPGYVSELLSGSRNAHPRLLLDLAQALNCPVVVLEAKRTAS